MSEKLSSFEFSQLLLDIVTASYNINVVDRSGKRFKLTRVSEIDRQKDIRTYDVSTEGRILFNESTEYDTIEIKFTINDEPVSYKLKSDSWLFSDTNE